MGWVESIVNATIATGSRYIERKGKGVSERWMASYLERGMRLNHFLEMCFPQNGIDFHRLASDEMLIRLMLEIQKLAQLPTRERSSGVAVVLVSLLGCLIIPAFYPAAEDTEEACDYCLSLPLEVLAIWSGNPIMKGNTKHIINVLENIAPFVRVDRPMVKRYLPS